MPKKIYKELIVYICQECNKNFGNRKDNYETHTNRKKPCVKIAPDTPVITPDTPKMHQTIPTNTVIKQTNELKSSSNANNKKFCCEFCNQYFSRKFCLDRHLDGRCKLKQNNNDEKIKQNNNDEKLNLILKQNEELKNEIQKLKSKIKKNKSNININNNQNINQQNYNINVINNNNNNIINFNDMNYNNFDKKLFIEPIMDRKLFGKAIILKMIENIYINDNLPECQNLVITDKNRGYVKVFNNGMWKTDNLNTINLVLNGIVEHSKLILDELYQRYLNNNQAKNRLNTSEKYINYCNLEHVEELIDEHENEQVDNKDEIKRCEDFREMVFKDTINLFHDNKNILLKPKNRLID